MEKSWMQLPRILPQYTKGVEEFITVASNHVDSLNRTRCPCQKCTNRVFKHIDVVEEHLNHHGMDKSYTRWVYHGEDFEVLSDDDEDDNGNGDGYEGERYEGLEDMIDDLQASTHMDHSVPEMQHEELRDSFAAEATEREAFTSRSANTSKENLDFFDQLLSDARKPLYPGCEKFSKLDFLVKLLHLKTINKWSNKSFDMNLKLIKAVLPSGETLPKSYYEAKTLMRNLGFGYIPIHACINDCVLFWKECDKLENCPKCHESRYKIIEGKGKKVPVKVLRYFPLAPRLQRLFVSRMTAEDMRWHKEKRVREENVLRHPADSKAWEEFDKEHEWFANDPRNVRLGLASDGFNPFGNMSNAYSMWPVLLMPYNLPPWKCNKEPFIFMSLLIPGPKSPGNDIDVYLEPLIDELVELWENGVDTCDDVTKQTFRLHAALLWTINDFPAFGNLSGWSTKGKMACPTCNKDTISMWLKHSLKLCYMNHGRFLPRKHRLRNQSMQLFGGNSSSKFKPKELSGDDLLSQMECIDFQSLGKAQKKRKRTEIELNWTKKSIFFDLPYWRTLKLRHNLDVMHIEKNICENVLGTLLKLDGKTKDTVKTRLDVEDLGIRNELHLIPNGDKFIIPHAPYTLLPANRKNFCEWLKLVKFPDGYASNIGRCANAKEGKISGMKSHDCHVLLQRLLPVAIRGFLDKDVSTALIELGIFFRELCSRTLRLELLEKMEKDIAVILCKLEQIFPPTFFDVMVHLAVHLPREAILGGPVHYRWMYPIERFLHTLKQYVRNKARPEGSIAEAYIDTECLTFCSMYLQGIETRFNRKDRNYDGGNRKQVGLQVFAHNVRALGASKTVQLDFKDFNKAHYYVLNNSDEVLPYVKEHMIELEKESSHQLEQRQEKYFAKWFEECMQKLRDEKSPKATDELYSLACGPDQRINRYNGCIVNGIRFHTKDRELRLRTQNSGVVVKGDHQSNEIEFYGVITDILELEYIFDYRVFLFKCDWWDVGNKKTGIQTDGHFTSVNVSKTWYKDDPFVLSSQANQVFYVNDTKMRGSWQVVQKVKPRSMYDVLEKEEEVNAMDGDEAYQQEEQLAVNGIILPDQTNETSNNEFQNDIELNRDDMDQDVVEASVVRTSKERCQVADTFINDEESDKEDDTLMDYCSDQEDIIPSDYDTDIE